jgi:hypothetical protein
MPLSQLHRHTTSTVRTATHSTTKYTDSATFDVLSGIDEDSFLQVYDAVFVVCFGEACCLHVQDGMKITQYLFPHLTLPRDCQQNPQFNSLNILRCSSNRHSPGFCDHLRINDPTTPKINHTEIIVRYNPVSLQGSPFLGATAKLRKPTTSFVMCVCPPARLFACKNSAPTERIVMIFDIRVFFKICREHLSYINIWQE